ncbi:MAG: cytochrome c [Bacteroidales bacterium]|jgi:mono/diheme cytochrome c family protein|nr:cytochrome c [Bacteroidales bacterium]
MKTKLINRLIVLAGTIVFAFAFMAFISPQDGQKKGAPWDIPSKYAKMENPYANDDLTKVGKMLYSKHCKSCHGNNGLGDGPKAKQLETFPGDFSSEAFQSETDGELYYKSFIGRDEMPNYEKKITDEEDRWAIINYLRTLK